MFLTVPHPSVFLTTGSSVVVGATATLQCTVNLQQYTSYSIVPITLTVVLLKGTATLMIDSNPTGFGSVRTSVFTIPNVGVSNAGQYQCRATVRTTQSNMIDSSPGVSNTANLYIQSEYSNTICMLIATLEILVFCFLSTTTTATIDWRYHTLSGFYCYPTVQCGSAAVHRLLIHTNHCHCGTTQGKHTSHDRLSSCG